MISSLPLVLLASGLLFAAPGHTPVDDALVVITTTPSVRRVERHIELAGSVRPVHQVLLRARRNGFVEQVLVDLGDRVQAGQPLVRLSLPELADQRRLLELAAEQAGMEEPMAQAGVREQERQLAVTEAEERAAQADAAAAAVDRDLARVEAARSESLHADGAATDQELDRARAAMQRAQAESERVASRVAVAQARQAEAEQALVRARMGVELARQHLAVARAALQEHDTLAAYAELQAPFDGTIVERLVHPGALVGTGGNPTPLLRLISAGPVRVTAPLPETELPFVRVGTPARVSGRGLGGAVLEAKVTRMAGALTESDRSMPLQIELSDPRLVPGMSVRVDLTLESRLGALVVPAGCLHDDPDGQPFVWLVRGGKAHAQRVQVDSNDLTNAELTGLDPGAVVVLSAREELTEGRAVRPAADLAR